jgi:hypothetical protein
MEAASGIRDKKTAGAGSFLINHIVLKTLLKIISNFPVKSRL